MQVDTTECCFWQNQNVIWTWNILVHTVECKWIQRSVVVGKTRMLLGQGNAAVSQLQDEHCNNGFMHDLKTFD